MRLTKRRYTTIQRVSLRHIPCGRRRFCDSFTKRPVGSPCVKSVLTKYSEEGIFRVWSAQDSAFSVKSGIPTIWMQNASLQYKYCTRRAWKQITERVLRYTLNTLLKLYKRVLIYRMNWEVGRICISERLRQALELPVRTANIQICCMSLAYK
jgi:hypothetical protein